MSAPQKGLRDSPASTGSIGIIAGGGSLPQKLAYACENKGMEVFIIAFEGQTDPAVVEGRGHMWTRLGASAQAIAALRSHNICDLVFIGSMRRPTLAELRPDIQTAKIFARIGMKAIGDNDLLGLLRDYLAEEGFAIRGIQEFADDLLAPQGAFGRFAPGRADWADIQRGFEASQILGAADIGQSVIVQEGIVLGVEASEGTDELIRRCKHLHRKGRGGILVKTCKPQQDRSLDLPTIGPETVKEAAQAGLAGIAVHAQQSLVIDIQKVAEIADQNRIFVVGFDPLQLLSKG